jgi:hypothetical protein
MHDSLGVQLGERVSESVGEHCERRLRQWPVVFDNAIERRRGDVLGGEPGPAGLRVPVQQGGHPATLDGSRDGDLPGEPLPERRVGRESAVHHLDRRLRPVGGPTEIHLAHATGAQTALQKVRTELPRVVRRQRFHGCPLDRRDGWAGSHGATRSPTASPGKIFHYAHRCTSTTVDVPAHRRLIPTAPGQGREDPAGDRPELRHLDAGHGAGLQPALPVSA